MRKCLVLITCIYSFASDAQNVGIGVPNPQNKLHVGGGFRLDTLAGVGGAGLVRHDANGVVYGLKFTGNTNDVLRGDGTFGTYSVNGNIGWLLNGNSGTNPATNFLGTTDNVAFNIRVNNLPSGLIDPTSGNTGWGYQTLSSNPNGLNNTAVGSGALKNSNASYNTAVGVNALGTTGQNSYNSAFGTEAMLTNSGVGNSAFGFWALHQNSGSQNCAFGFGSLQTNGANRNSAFGSNALAFNQTGSNNTAIGTTSLGSNTVGNDNTAIGNNALGQSISGSFNTATGSGALLGNKASFNSAFGFEALNNNNILSSSDHNSALGYRALRVNTGLGNTAVGSSALINNISGTLNTGIGTLAGSGLPNNVSNATCLGYGTGWNTTSSNQVNIGNFSISWIGGQTGWFHYSDKRIKNDIKEDVPGLSFITRLKPITYHVDIDKQEEIANAGKAETNSELIKPVKKDWQGKYDVEKIKMTGFFAQDVEETAKAINYSFNGVYNPKNGGLLSLDYSAFVVPLVKAVQEQQKIIEDQNKKIDKQQQQIDLLIKEMQSLKKDLITQKN